MMLRQSCEAKQISQKGAYRRLRSELGMTLLELIISCSILLILSSAALPIAKYSVVRAKEAELRNDLLEMREAIDRYKEAADKNQIKPEMGTNGYPPDLDTLVKGVQLGQSSDKKIRFLRKVPIDPMTGHADWGGKDVFDVYSTSTATALNGTKYSDW